MIPVLYTVVGSNIVLKILILEQICLKTMIFHLDLNLILIFQVQDLCHPVVQRKKRQKKLKELQEKD